MKLTKEEKAKLTRLEKIIKTNFYDEGLALKKIKEAKLYRSTHKSFDRYCLDEFKYSGRKADYLISASSVVDNFKFYNKSTKDPLQKIKVFPTAESQIRFLAQFPPTIQIKLWKQAVHLAKGKVPTAKIVNAVIDIFKRKDKKLNPETEKRLPQIQLVPVTKPSIGQRIRVNSKYSLFAGVEGIITQIPNPDSAIVKLDNSQKRKLINIENLETQTIIFPQKDNKFYPIHDGINYKPGYGSGWYAILSKEVHERLKEYSEQIHKTFNGTISNLLDIEMAQRLATV